jgi:hypothetical protein
MMNRVTAIHCALISATIGFSQFALAQDGQTNRFQSIVQQSSEHDIPAEACQRAFIAAENEALDQLDSHFDEGTKRSYVARLVAQKETRTLRDNNKTVCVFEGTWEGKEQTVATDLINTELFIEGQYSGNCLDERNGDVCWQRLIREARSDLLSELERQYGDLDQIDLAYLDFEGRQRDEYANKRLEMTADGKFFFKAVPAGSLQSETRVSIHRSESKQAKPLPAEETTSAPNETKPSKPKKQDNLDFTLFYVWDGNDTAAHENLAISSDRWGVGLWAKNRVGFSVFKGTDTLGIGSDRENVKNDSASYETLGVGMGYRLWNTRGITMENMLYLVDAKPYAGTVSPNCASCTDVSFASKDYLQATVNLKTNSKGVNVGWMLTWKILEDASNVDALSSGFYLEAQF